MRDCLKPFLAQLLTHQCILQESVEFTFIPDIALKMNKQHVLIHGYVNHSDNERELQRADRGHFFRSVEPV